MIGRLIRAYRRENNLSQADLNALLKQQGCDYPLKKICNLENDAARGKPRIRLTEKQLVALQAVTQVEMPTLRFLNGEIPMELRTAKDLTLSQIRTGMAMLYAACGVRENAPAITHDLAVRMHLIEEASTPKGELRAYKRLLREGKALPDDSERRVVDSVKTALAERQEEPSAMEKLLDSLGMGE